MSELTVVNISRLGVNPAGVAAAVGGDKFANNGRVFVHIKNASVGSINVTLDIKQTVDGQAVTDPVVAVPAGEERLIGPFAPSVYNDSAGFVNLSYSAVTTLTVAPFQLIPETN